MSLFLILALLVGVVADDFELPPDIVYGNITRTGTMMGFQIGDERTLAVVDLRNGGTEAFWSFDPLLNYFLALHVDQAVVLEIEDVETWLMHEEEMVRLLRVVDASAGGTTFEEWGDSLRAIGEPEVLLDDFFTTPYDYIYGAGEEEVVSDPRGGGGR
ncbi:MAG: hypothetical protein JXA64_05955 [Candidatus Fermentibacteraceae bacterium]|nr:hypothetical protein [Candidatus Fermentibacteraceae bacterium]MBN2608640.1 hypothetical protein [Candidatus Fermentibacteraceae bacterium]